MPKPFSVYSSIPSICQDPLIISQHNLHLWKTNLETLKSFTNLTRKPIFNTNQLWVQNRPFSEGCNDIQPPALEPSTVAGPSSFDHLTLPAPGDDAADGC